MRKLSALTALWSALCIATLAAGPSADGPGSSPASSGIGTVRVDYYFEAGCAECLEVDRSAIPLLKARFEGLYTINRLDTGISSNYLRLLSVMKARGVRENEPVYMVINGKVVLAGARAINGGIARAVDDALASGEYSPPEPEVTGDESRSLLAKHFASFTVAGVMLAGLVDGVNPCAISTLVFMISVLSLSGSRTRNLLLTGGMFCLASFLTYMAIGFGLLHALRSMTAFHLMRAALDVVLLVVLAAFSFYSFRDACRFARSGNRSDVTMQLPDSAKRLIRGVLRSQLSGGAGAMASFGAGAAVTAIESVCTGQVYAPTMAMAARSSDVSSRPLFYLLLYNLMFMLPLVAAFFVTYFGVKLGRLTAIGTRSVVAGKILLGVFFLLLAFAVVLLRT